MSESTEIATVSSNNVRAEIANMASGANAVFSTIVGEGFEAKALLLEALSNSVPVAENLGKRINLVDVVVEAIDLPNEQTKEMETQPRVILLDEDGSAYHAISGPFLRDVQRLLSVMGQPSAWPGALPVKAIKAGQGTRQYFTLKLDNAPAAPAAK